MGRVNRDDVGKYNTGGGGKFFSLKNDKDNTSVRFMLDDIDDLNDYIYAVHRVSVPGAQWDRNVNCLRDYNDPVDDCPFCREHKPVTTRLFLPLYDVNEDTVKIWERPSGFIKKMESLCSRYKHLVSHIFEIERNGKPRDPKTTYEIYETDKDDTELEDLPEVPEILGLSIMDKSADDMEYYLEEGDFPPDEEDEAPVRRKPSSKRRDAEDEDEDEEEEEETPRRKPARENRGERTERRTPAKGRDKKRKEDKF